VSLDAVALTQALIRCPSVTPADEGALDLLAATLRDLGFACHRLRFDDAETAPVENLYARRGDAAPNFCFAGHSDVVPIGDRNAWSVDPFAGEVVDGMLYGRGAADMKGAVAAFVAAAAGFLDDHPDGVPGSISLLITGDEEGPAINGTRKVLTWMAEHGERIDACLVGEPTNPERLGEMIKIGRRGSLTGTITVSGTQGHVAYPHLAENPVPGLIRLLAAIVDEELDTGSDVFQPSNLEVTTIDVGNPSDNVIPSRATAQFNIRFNDRHSGESLVAWLRERLDGTGVDYRLDVRISGEPFLTPAGGLSDAVADSVADVTGRRPELSTSGGTSDARFIKDHCPVVEFGLVGRTMHKIDEHISCADLQALTAIYRRILDRFFGAP
jgi:succinyl-diaminopimelate desuccinylase